MDWDEEIAAEWAAEDARDATEEAFRESKHEQKAEHVAEAAARKRKGKRGQMSEEDAHDLAHLGWVLVDEGACKLDKRLKNNDEQHTRLVDASTPVIQKYVPEGTDLKSLGELIPIELWLLGVVAFTYVPKVVAIREADRKEAEEKSRADNAKETTGTVIGRRLNAVP